MSQKAKRQQLNVVEYAKIQSSKSTFGFHFFWLYCILSYLGLLIIGLITLVLFFVFILLSFLAGLGMIGYVIIRVLFLTHEPNVLNFKTKEKHLFK